MLLKVLSSNVRHGGVLSPTGAGDDRWPSMAALVAEVAPDVLALQETQPWSDHNCQQVLRAEHDTGMRAVWKPLDGGSTLLMYQPETMGLRQWEDRYARERDEPGFPGIGVFDIPGLVSPLSIASVHLAPDSALLAQQQVERVSWRCRRYLGPQGEGENGVVVGDVNQPQLPHPLDPPVPEPALLPAANLSGRWSTTPVGGLTPNRGVAESLARGRWTDTAHIIADRTGRTDVLAPTGRGGWRVDQAWVTEGLVPAVLDHQQLTVPGSDHKGLLITLETDLADPSLVAVPNR